MNSDYGKSVYVRKKTYQYIKQYAYLHNVSISQAIDDLINHYKSCERKKEISKLGEKLGDSKLEEKREVIKRLVDADSLRERIWEKIHGEVQDDD